MFECLLIRALCNIYILALEFVYVHYSIVSFVLGYKIVVMSKYYFNKDDCFYCNNFNTRVKIILTPSIFVFPRTIAIY